MLRLQTLGLRSTRLGRRAVQLAHTYFGKASMLTTSLTLKQTSITRSVSVLRPMHTRGQLSKVEVLRKLLQPCSSENEDNNAKTYNSNKQQTIQPLEEREQQQVPISPARQKELWLKNLLEKSKQDEGSNNGSPPAVDRESFLVVLREIAESGEPDAPMRAERWIRKLEEMAASYPTAETLQPTPECYQRVIETWCKAAQTENIDLAIARAENMLQPHRIQNTATCNAFLDLCTLGRGSKVRGTGTRESRHKVEQHAQRANNLLQRMIHDRIVKGESSSIAPDVDSFNFVIRGWTRCRQTNGMAERAIEALNMFVNYCLEVDSTVLPNTKSHAMIMDALAIRAKQKVMAALENQIDAGKLGEESNGLEEISALESIIRELHQAEVEGHDYLAPTQFIYNTLIACWANLAPLHPNAPTEAEKVFQRMNHFAEAGRGELAPVTRSYGIVQRAWANSKHDTRAQRTAWWLTKLKRDYEASAFDPRLRPTTYEYNQAIRAWCDAGQPRKAEQLFQELIENIQDNKEQPNGTFGAPGPDSESFALIIRGWVNIAAKGSKEGLERAIQLNDTLLQMEKADTGLKTSFEMFNIILRGASRCASVHPEVLDLAVDVFDKLRLSHHKVDCDAYAHLLQTGLQSLSHPDNDHVRCAFVKELIRDCSEAGLVGNSVLRALSNGNTFRDGWTVQESAKATAQVFPQFPLPNSWTRNVRPATKLPQQADLVRTNFRLVRRPPEPGKFF